MLSLCRGHCCAKVFAVDSHSKSHCWKPKREFVNTATLSKSFTCRRSRQAVGAKVASMTFHPLVHIMYLTFRCHKLSSKVGQAAPASKVRLRNLVGTWLRRNSRMMLWDVRI